MMKCIDRFNKMVQVLPLQESDVHTVIDIFLSIVVSQHRLPKCTMSDYDPHFHGHFWEELMSLLEMVLIFSMASHYQTDGMAEVVNHTME